MPPRQRVAPPEHPRPEHPRPDHPRPEPAPSRPGSRGEHQVQRAYRTEERAARFYADQMRDRLLPTMIEFVARMEMAFVATSDSGGDCDSSLRSGPPGFIQVLDERHLAYPEYRGNGVHASLGNITENPHVGLLMVDFERDLIGLHVNGAARIVADADLRAVHPELPSEPAPGRRAERWVVVEVREAYIHCRKHIPRMARVHERRDWGTDDPARKGGDYFGVKAERAAARNGPPEGQGGPPRANGRPRGQDGSGTPAPAEPPEPKPASRRRWWPFPSTTRMSTGSTAARPSPTARRPDDVPHSRGLIRWLSS